MSLIKSNKQKQSTLALEDIDYLIAAQRMAELSTSLENDQEDLNHASDIASSLESLDQVMESIKEIDVYDAALIEVVGNIAGASSGIHGSYFTPSMEAAEDTGPSMGQKIKAIYDKIIEMLRIIISKVKAYIAHLFSTSFKLAKTYESLGEKIQNYNFVNAKPVTIEDLNAVKGGPKGIIAGLEVLNKATELVLSTAPKIFQLQVEMIYDVKDKSLSTENPHLNTIATLTTTASQGSTAVSSGTEDFNTLLHSRPMINNIIVSTYIFDANTQSPPASFAHRVFSAKTGLAFTSTLEHAKTSSVVMSHSLANDIFEGLRPLIDSLVNKSKATSFIAILEGIEKEGEKLDQYLHQAKSSVKIDDVDPQFNQSLTIYSNGLKAIIDGQMASFVKSHKVLESTVMCVMSYLDKCLHVAPVATQPKPAAQAT